MQPWEVARAAAGLFREVRAVTEHILSTSSYPSDILSDHPALVRLGNEDELALPLALADTLRESLSHIVAQLPADHSGELDGFLAFANHVVGVKNVFRSSPETLGKLAVHVYESSRIAQQMEEFLSASDALVPSFFAFFGNPEHDELWQQVQAISTALSSLVPEWS